MQPNTEVGITGVGIEVPFIRGLLDKLGIVPEFYARHEYKNAAVSLLSKGFSPEYRSETEKLGGGIFQRMAADIAADRGLDEGDVKKAVDEAPVAAEKALEKKAD